MSIDSNFAGVVPPPPLRSGQQDADGLAHRPRRRRRRRANVGPLVALVAIAGFFAWSTTQDGGINGVVERFTDWVEGRVDDVTGSAEVGDAVDYLNGRYHDEGTYPQLSAQEVQTITEVHLAGLELERCSPQHMVVSAFTARGTVSYLLVAGENWGRVEGRPGCPANLLAPTPWTVPLAEPAS